MLKMGKIRLAKHPSSEDNSRSEVTDVGISMTQPIKVKTVVYREPVGICSDFSINKSLSLLSSLLRAAIPYSVWCRWLYVVSWMMDTKEICPPMS